MPRCRGSPRPKVSLPLSHTHALHRAQGYGANGGRCRPCAAYLGTCLSMSVRKPCVSTFFVLFLGAEKTNGLRSLQTMQGGRARPSSCGGIPPQEKGGQTRLGHRRRRRGHLVRRRRGHLPSLRPRHVSRLESSQLCQSAHRGGVLESREWARVSRVSRVSRVGPLFHPPL